MILGRKTVVKFPAQNLAHSKCSINGGYYFLTSLRVIYLLIQVLEKDS